VQNPLGFELVRENEISFPQKRFVFWDFVFRDVEFAIVAHDRVEYFAC
jgi:hypothetical protein